MMSTMKNPLLHTDSLSTLDHVHNILPLKPSLTTIPSNVSHNVLSAPALHKRRPQKRVRFALTLEPVEEDSLPSSPEILPPLMSKSIKRHIDPWSQHRPLYGNYIEYLKKQNAFASHETQTDQVSSLPSSPTLEPSSESATYTHTFVIQSKSPTIVIDSITVSTPPLHLPQIIHRKPKSNRRQSSSATDTCLKQQLTLSTPPRMLHTKKLANSTNQRHHYISIHAVANRTESYNKAIQSDNILGSKTMKENIQNKKSTENMIKPLRNPPNQINHFSDRTNLPISLKKARIPNRIRHINDELNLNKNYFFQNSGNDHLLQPIIH
ncbi:unnamed protein product [Adineta steineri]|uniref:Uncharacterized protein n=1 Tax=Adineta steineri TaxID=433720 RepID=A0A813XBI2_9BILA|nr:unnamed protein product [Adineta steineri]CAF3853300.1 unnamed protein product [Adineta steineri]